MKFFFKRKDGGANSTVTGYWLIECKSLFSIVLLRFDKGSREAYHSHAFNAVTWFLSGLVREKDRVKGNKLWKASLTPKYTPRSCLHKVVGIKPAWAISFRGPWKKTWEEYLPKTGQTYTLTHGRKIV